MLGNRHPELLSLKRVIHRQFERALVDTNGLGGDTEPRMVEGCQRNLQTLPRPTDQTVTRYATILKDQRPANRGVQPEFFFRLSDHKARGIGGHCKGTDALLGGLRIGACENDKYTSLR